MDAYSVFAQIYDECMDNVPYAQGAARIQELLTEHQIPDGLVADLGCGTGTMTELLAERGYDMIGIDSSSDMLEIAMDKRFHSGLDILYLQQSMQAFELYGTVRAIISYCDCVNYIIDSKELQEFFRLANNYLDPKGLLIFDFHTTHYYETVLGNSTFADSREDMSYIWNNYYDSETAINEYELDLFIRDTTDIDPTEVNTDIHVDNEITDTDIPEENDELYRRYREEHIQRGYTLSQIRQFLEQAGLIFIDAFDDYTAKPATDTSSRIVVVACEHGK